ncbi:TPA: acetyl-CoA carboxylase biotin carboxyl carrier protein [Streptococcus pneumoniae]
MNLNDIKDLMTQFDQSSLREFSYKNGTDELQFSKNEARPVPEVATQVAPAPVLATPSPVAPTSAPAETVAEEVPAPAEAEEVPAPAEASVASEGNLVESPLVGVVYLAAGPDKPAFVTVGDSVKKGQTLVIIEAMKVMNEIPAPKDGVVTEILVSNEEMVEFGKGLVRIK